MDQAEFVQDTQTGAIFEGFIIVIASILCVMIYLRYIKKRTLLTKFLLFSFLSLDVAIIFSMISKIIYLTIYQIGLYPDAPYYWILQRISGFRISLAFVLLAILFTYLFKINIFTDKDKVHVNPFFIVYCFASIIFVVVYSTWSFAAPADDSIGFLLVTIAMIWIYFPFMHESIKLLKKIEESAYKKAIFSLFLTALSFVLIFVCFLTDNILSIFTGPNYSIFYYFAWIFGVMSIAFAYFGYIRPSQ